MEGCMKSPKPPSVTAIKPLQSWSLWAWRIRDSGATNHHNSPHTKWESRWSFIMGDSRSTVGPRSSHSASGARSGQNFDILQVQKLPTTWRTATYIRRISKQEKFHRITESQSPTHSSMLWLSWLDCWNLSGILLLRRDAVFTSCAH